jgi:prepilin-type N-terminal cleavage/methylation domain-containing protein
MKKNKGFTLIELMIVVAIISILMGATFKLINVAADAKARSVTTKRLECLQFALSGYYAAYGMYPAVQNYQNPNLQLIERDDDTAEPLNSGSAGAATACARAQPMAYEYPTPLFLDEPVVDSEYRDKLQSLLKDPNAISVNKIVDSLDAQGTSWADNKGFKFGLISFLLPRVDVAGLPNSQNGPKTTVFAKGQWKGNNPMSKTEEEGLILQKLELQRGLEENAAKQWLPYLENMLSSFRKEIYGIKIAGGGLGLVKRGKYMQSGDKKNSENSVYLAHSTVTDGWGREFFYYSAPPHQSYRIWSAGKDGCTFPPWESLTTEAKTWIKDDIVGGKM